MQECSAVVQKHTLSSVNIINVTDYLYTQPYGIVTPHMAHTALQIQKAVSAYL